MLTSGCQNVFIDYEKSKVPIAVVPIMDVNTVSNSSLEFLQRAYWSPEFTCKWLKNPTYNDCWPLFTTQDEWTIIKYTMEVSRPCRYWTLWMWKWHTVTLHHVIAVFQEKFNHMDGIMRALAKKRTQWKEELYFAVKFARQKLSQYYAEVTPTTGMLLISEHILDPSRKLQLLRKWDKGMDINHEEKTSDTTQYQVAFLTYVVNEYCTKQRQLSVTKPEIIRCKNRFRSAMDPGYGEFFSDPYNLSSDHEEYLMPDDVAEATPGWRDCPALSLTVTRLYLNSPTALPKNWGRNDVSVNDYHSDPMEITSTLWIPYVTDLWN